MAARFSSLSRRCTACWRPLAGSYQRRITWFSTTPGLTPSAVPVQADAPPAAVRPKIRTEDTVRPTDGEAMERITNARNACKAFKKDAPIPEDVLKKILALTMVRVASSRLASLVLDVRAWLCAESTVSIWLAAVCVCCCARCDGKGRAGRRNGR